MTTKRIVLASAAMALAAAPVTAQQARAVPVRDAAPVEGSNALGGALGGESTLFFVLGIAAVAAAIVFLSEDDDPVSP
ncbi:hypothetical protein [Qipengyuania sp. MTN3-11]|uniref:hypothetical protein n=1 Tax=Qipengyuania sp. MTN3-11 TaxID=3056557 RepID=UPI0036F20196